MIVGIHNVRHDNDNRDALFAQMKQEVEKVKVLINALAKPGVLDSIVADAVRPFVAEAALREKELGQRPGNLANRKSPSYGFRLPKGD